MSIALNLLLKCIHQPEGKIRMKIFSKNSSDVKL